MALCGLVISCGSPPESPALAPSSATATASATGEVVPIGRRCSLFSDVLEESREYLVYQPAERARGHRDRYPVIYLLDGESHFHHVWGIVDFLSAQRRIPPSIVVAIPNTDRRRDLGATRDHSQDGASRFLRFLETELAPHIDETIRPFHFAFSSATR